MVANSDDYLEIGRQVIRDEITALENQLDKLGESFNTACKWIKNCTGRIIWIGVGQSWHVARKNACSMASLGHPSFYVHTTEAVHGDMGLITSEDLVIFVSHSGRTKEVLDTLGPIGKIGPKTIAIVGNPGSPLGKDCDLVVSTGVTQEAGPIKFAPSSSALVTVSLGDALIMAVAHSIGFNEDAYSQYHPGGAIGEELTAKKIGKDVLDR